MQARDAAVPGATSGDVVTMFAGPKQVGTTRMKATEQAWQTVHAYPK